MKFTNVFTNRPFFWQTQTSDLALLEILLAMCLAVICWEGALCFKCKILTRIYSVQEANRPDMF